MTTAESFDGFEMAPEADFLLTLAKARERFAEAMEYQQADPHTRFVLVDSLPSHPKDLATFGIARKGAPRVIGGENDIIEVSLPISHFEGRNPILSRDPDDEAFVITYFDTDDVIRAHLVDEANFRQIFPDEYGMAVGDFYEKLSNYEVVPLRIIA